MKDLKILISSVLIFISFFVGYIFWYVLYDYEQGSSWQNIHKVYINIDNNELRLWNESSDVEIYLNWNYITEKEYVLNLD